MSEVAERTGKHPVDAMLDIAVTDDLRTVFYAEPANVNRDAMREIIEYEWILPGVSDGGAHTKFFTGGRYPTEFLSRGRWSKARRRTSSCTISSGLHRSPPRWCTISRAVSGGGCSGHAATASSW